MFKFEVFMAFSMEIKTLLFPLFFLLVEETTRNSYEL